MINLINIINYMSSKSILHVVNIYFVLPYFIGDQFKYMKSKGYDMHVISSPSEYLSSYAEKQGFKYREIQVSRTFSIFQDLKSLLEIIKYIRNNNIKIVVGHTPKGALLAMLASAVLRVPDRIYFRHGLMYETSKGFKYLVLITMERFTSLCAKKVVCVSQSIFDKSLEHKLNNKNKQIVIGRGTCGGIDAINKFNPEIINKNRLFQLKLDYQISESDFVIGYCGRLVRDKGIVELVKAIVNLNKKYKVKLLLVGDYEERDALPKDTIDIIERDPNIIKTGFIFKDIEYYYCLMNMFILPSYREGFGMSVLEASAMKLPVLTTRVTGCVDSIIEGITGFYVENSSESIEKEIISIMFNCDGNVIGANGRDFVLKYFDNRILWPLFEKQLYSK